MKVLVSAASRHGATADIARTIGDTLTEEGLEAVVLPPDAVTTLDGYAGVVLGSGIYVGHWMDAAKNLVERHSAALASLPVWLFSSGPIGEPPKPDEDPADIAEIIEATHAREHRVFAGKVDKSVLGLGEKVLLKAVRAPEGDFRPWARRPGVDPRDRGSAQGGPGLDGSLTVGDAPAQPPAPGRRRVPAKGEEHSMNANVRRGAAVFLALHGLIHLMGFVAAWQLATLPELAYRTTAFNGAVEIGDAGARVIGIAWLVGVALFFVAAWALWRNTAWALRGAVVAAAVSAVTCAAWLPDAFLGLAVDVVIIVGAAVLVIGRSGRPGLPAR